jgi:hypothetical protein
MIYALFFFLLIAGITIYNLNETVKVDKIIKSNYSFKERIQTLEGLIEYTERQEEKELSEREIANGVKTKQEQIISFKEEIVRLHASISWNEKILREKKGRKF